MNDSATIEDLRRRLQAAETALRDKAAVEAALRASEERFRTLAETAPALIWQIDAEGRKLFVNRQFANYAGLSTDEIESSDWLALVHPDDAPGFSASLEAARGGQVVWQNRSRIRQRDGAWRWFENNARPLFDGAGHYQGHVGVSTDVDEAVRAELLLRESEQQQSLTVKLVPALLWWTNPDGRVIVANDRWTEFTGQCDADLHEFGWLAAIHPDDVVATRSAFEQAFATGEPLERHQRIRQVDGRFRWHFVRQVPLRNETGAITRWFGAAIDVHEQRQLQDRQNVLLAELQHRVRNILAMMRSLVSRTGESSVTVVEFASHLEGRIDALARTQAVLTRAPGQGVDFELMVREELLAQAAPEERADIAGPTVRLAPKAAEVLTLAIHELATNAVKYGALSSTGGHIDLRWQCAQRDGADWLHMSWAETGVSIAGVAPRRVGFGTELIERRVPYELQGQGRLEFRPGGVQCTIDVPLRSRDSILQTHAPRHKTMEQT